MDNGRKTVETYMRLIAGRLRHSADRQLEGLGITKRQGEALWIMTQGIKQNHEITRKYLSEAMELSGPSVTSLLDSLEKKELVTRNIDSSDHRALDISITHKGQALIGTIEKMIANQQQLLLGGLTETEANTLCSLLEKVLQNVEQ